EGGVEISRQGVVVVQPLERKKLHRALACGSQFLAMGVRHQAVFIALGNKGRPRTMSDLLQVVEAVTHDEPRRQQREASLRDVRGRCKCPYQDESAVNPAAGQIDGHATAK